MSLAHQALLQQIIDSSRRLYDRNLIAAGDSSISYRISDSYIAITPTGISKAFMKSEEIACVALDGSILDGHPSSECSMHLIVYRNCPKARCVIHAHPPTAIAWSLVHPDSRELPIDSLPEVILSAGSIPIVPYARSGTDELAERLFSYIPQHRLLVLARRGALCWGETLAEALLGIERVEHVATILRIAHGLGGAVPLSDEEVTALKSARQQLGPRIV